MANWTIISAMTSTIQPGATAATPATAGGPRRCRPRPVEISVPMDRDGSFEPLIVPKRQRRGQKVLGSRPGLTSGTTSSIRP
jgi:transposase-like protein